MKSFTKERINQATQNGTDLDIRVTHIQLNTPNNKGGMTVAYKTTFRHGQTIEISTSVCSDKDQFDKAIGRTLAIERFLEGKTITVPYNKDLFENPVAAINALFESCYY